MAAFHSEPAQIWVTLDQLFFLSPAVELNYSPHSMNATQLRFAPMMEQLDSHFNTVVSSQPPDAGIHPRQSRNLSCVIYGNVTRRIVP